MSLASTANPHARHFSRSPFIDQAAEAKLFAWAHQQRGGEIVGYAFEDIVAPEGGDEADRRDVADSALRRMASERDPNEAFHDRYTGTVFA